MKNLFRSEATLLLLLLIPVPLARYKKGGKRNKILIYGRNENGNEFRNKKLIYRGFPPPIPSSFLLTRPRPVAFIYLHMIFRQIEFE
jgi:hypothetical protein